MYDEEKQTGELTGWNSDALEGDEAWPEPASNTVSYRTATAAPAVQLQRPEGRQSPRPVPQPDESKPEAPATANDNAEQPQRRRPLRRVIFTLLPLLALGAGSWYGHYWWTMGRFFVTTDDAYVGADNTTISAKVSGYVAAVDVTDNAHVRTGDVIVRIDDGDYKLAVQTARDNIASQQAAINRIGKQIIAQQAGVDQAKAQLASAKAGLTRAELELKRQQDLATRDFASRQTLEQAQANRDQAVASVQGGQAALEAAEANVEVLKGQRVEAERTLDQLKTALAKAERDLSFTVIKAPFDGVIGNRAVQAGDYVQPGQRLASLVPLDAVYIDANFKETQLARLQPGQPVSISVDAHPDLKITGIVDSLAPASGSVFSLLPPDNATGNFTKIVQRVPVRIRVPKSVATEELLRPGMSVVVSANTKPGAAVSPAVAETAGSASSAKAN